MNPHGAKETADVSNKLRATVTLYNSIQKCTLQDEYGLGLFVINGLPSVVNRN